MNSKESKCIIVEDIESLQIHINGELDEIYRLEDDGIDQLKVECHSGEI